MQLIVGLGNPGDKYQHNRHNIGFLAIDAMARRHGFPPFREKFQGLVSEGQIAGTRVLLLKPQTFMNASGDSVQKVVSFYKLAPSDVTVIYDEIDLAPGKTRVKIGGGNGGTMASARLTRRSRPIIGACGSAWGTRATSRW